MNKEIRKFIDIYSGQISFGIQEKSFNKSMDRFIVKICNKYSITEYMAGKIIDDCFDKENFICHEFVLLVDFKAKKYIENMDEEQREVRSRILRSKISLEDRLFEIEKKLGIV